MNLYPKIVERTFDAILGWIQEVNGERQKDVGDWNNLPQRFMLGRNRTLLADRVEPTGATDVVATDAEGDIYHGASSLWVLTDIGAGVLEWLEVGAGGGGGGAPTNAQYVVMTANGTLTQERVLTAGNGVTITDNGAGSTVVIDATGSPNLDGGYSNSTYGAVSPIDGGASV